VTIRLYSYWRSSAAYRVRIALNLKGLDHDIVPVSLEPGVSEHRGAEYRAKNPQMLVPFLEDGELGIAQSMAILEYLEETYPDVALLPTTEPERSRVRAFCSGIACDIHPLNNLRVLQYLDEQFGAHKEQLAHWYQHWIVQGFSAFERHLQNRSHATRYCCGDKPGLADLCLVPQVYNAQRYNCDLDEFPQIMSTVDHCLSLTPFVDASPDNQPDAA